MSVPEVVPLDALFERGVWRSRSPEPVRDVHGVHVADLSLAPLPLVSRTLAALHRAGPPSAELLANALPEAARIFATCGAVTAADLFPK